MLTFDQLIFTLNAMLDNHEITLPEDTNGIIHPPILFLTGQGEEEITSRRWKCLKAISSPDQVMQEIEQYMQQQGTPFCLTGTIGEVINSYDNTKSVVMTVYNYHYTLTKEYPICIKWTPTVPDYVYEFTLINSPYTPEEILNA